MTDGLTVQERIARAIEGYADSLDADRRSREGRHQAANRWDLEMKAWGLRRAARIARETSEEDPAASRDPMQSSIARQIEEGTVEPR